MKGEDEAGEGTPPMPAEASGFGTLGSPALRLELDRFKRRFGVAIVRLEISSLIFFNYSKRDKKSRSVSEHRVCK